MYLKLEFNVPFNKALAPVLDCYLFGQSITGLSNNLIGYSSLDLSTNLTDLYAKMHQDLHINSLPDEVVVSPKDIKLHDITTNKGNNRQTVSKVGDNDYFLNAKDQKDVIPIIESFKLLPFDNFNKTTDEDDLLNGSGIMVHDLELDNQPNEEKTNKKSLKEKHHFKLDTKKSKALMNNIANKLNVFAEEKFTYLDYVKQLISL